MSPTQRQNLYVYNGGLLTGRRIRRILDLAGWDVRLGLPGPDDWVGVWGQSPTAPRGQKVANATGAAVLRVEDAFLRSVRTGREGDLPLGLCLDKTGVHFDPAQPSDLEGLLANHPLDDTALLDAARAGIARLRWHHLSKYNNFDPDAAVPDAPYVLVIDQTLEDASLGASQGNQARFEEMLVFAQTEHPGLKVIIKSHAETIAGKRGGHFGVQHENERIQILTDPVSPWALFEGATGVYTISSQLGFEAIFAGHKPRVFGQPFYAGWGLTADESPPPRRQRNLSRAQLFAAAMILYPTWFDPHRDALCSLDCVIDTLGAYAKAARQDAPGYVALGFRPWKHRHIRQFFGQGAGVRFAATAPRARAKAARLGRPIMGWGTAQGCDLRIEDGILRSRGLGAALVPPLSLVRDGAGIYYDPASASDLEQLIARATQLPPPERHRADDLIKAVRASHLTKYNLAAKPPEFAIVPGEKVVLVPGQVEDDASVLLGGGKIRSNLALLQAVRAQNPTATIIYKPHPDVEAGLRKGQIPAEEALKFADHLATDTDTSALLARVDSVATLTSTLGFEALLRGLPVSCWGMPFYAGWGLTQDFGALDVMRRSARPDIVAMAHAVLIDYPRYFDPVTGTACPPEVVVERLADGSYVAPQPTRLSRLVQNLFARIVHR